MIVRYFGTPIEFNITDEAENFIGFTPIGHRKEVIFFSINKTPLRFFVRDSSSPGENLIEEFFSSFTLSSAETEGYVEILVMKEEEGVKIILYSPG